MASLQEHDTDTGIEGGGNGNQFQQAPAYAGTSGGSLQPREAPSGSTDPQLPRMTPSSRAQGPSMPVVRLHACHKCVQISVGRRVALINIVVSVAVQITPGNYELFYELGPDRPTLVQISALCVPCVLCVL